jgi:hypothetical protein
MATNVPRTATTTHGFRPFTVKLKAADPRVYSRAELTDTMSVYDPSGAGGMDFDKDGVTDYVADGTAGEITALNSGNADAYPLLRIHGPPTGTMTGATVQNITTGGEAVFTFGSGLIATDIFTADFRRMVTLDGGDVPYVNLNGANRYGEWNLPRIPFTLAPGENVLRFIVTGTTTDANAVMVWRHTRL